MKPVLTDTESGGPRLGEADGVADIDALLIGRRRIVVQAGVGQARRGKRENLRTVDAGGSEQDAGGGRGLDDRIRLSAIAGGTEGEIVAESPGAEAAI